MPPIIRTVAVLLLVASAVAACGRPNAPRVPALPSAARVDGARFAVLPASEGPRVVVSCSPKADGGGWDPAGFWEPDSAAVREVEARLPALLDSVLPVVRRANGLDSDLRGERYYRQYLGITRRGERLVSVHGFHERMLRLVDELVGSRAAAIDWRGSVVAGCDVGAEQFGVIFDPRARTFGRLEFSDSFGGAVTY